MLRTCVLLAGLLAIALVLSPLNQNDSAYAISGCCKERNSSDDAWSDKGKSFKRCEATNEKLDKDEIFESTGKVWWDLAC